MDNNDILIRIRYALDMKNTTMMEIFKLGGVEVTGDEIREILTKTNDSDDPEKNNEDNNRCDDKMLDAFLDGFIIYKRGKQEPKPGQSAKSPLQIDSYDSLNNVLLKKLRIALTLTSEDILDIFSLAGITVTKNELSALLRKEGHPNYVVCGDKFARNFLKGLAVKQRG